MSFQCFLIAAAQVLYHYGKGVNNNKGESSKGFSSQQKRKKRETNLLGFTGVMQVISFRAKSMDVGATTVLPNTQSICIIQFACHWMVTGMDVQVGPLNEVCFSCSLFRCHSNYLQIITWMNWLLQRQNQEDLRTPIASVVQQERTPQEHRRNRLRREVMNGTERHEIKNRLKTGIDGHRSDCVVKTVVGN